MRISILGLLLLGLTTISTGQEVPSPSPGERLASQITYLIEGAARPSWSVQGDWIAYDRRGGDGFSDLYIGKPDDSIARCLTCDLAEFRKSHAGNADWHPSGRYLVFQSEKPFRQDDEPLPFLSIPGRNRGSGLWVISADGKDLWQLSGRQEGAFPPHSPRFSFEGGRLAWSERVATQGTWGDWVIRVGDFGTTRGVARVSKIRTLEPAAQKAFYEVHGFTPDDRSLLITGNLIEGQPIDGMDIYTVEIDSGEVLQLTKTLATWDRFPALAPDGRTLAWSSAQAMRLPERPVSRDDVSALVQMDIWLADTDGSWSRQLTGFNDALSEEYLGQVMVGPSAWGPGGDRLLVTLTSLSDKAKSDLFLISLKESFGYPTGDFASRMRRHEPVHVQAEVDESRREDEDRNLGFERSDR